MSWLTIAGFYKTVGFLETMISTKVVINTSSQIYDIISKVSTYQNLNTNDILEELDLEGDLRIVDSLMNDMEKSKSKIKKEKDEMCDSYIIVGPENTSDVALYNIYSISIKIKNLLEIIHKKMEEHRNKYFSYYRKMDIYEELKQLKKYKKILSTRLKQLLDIMKIFHST